ncbi:hypothetical protein GCM10027299_42020 [Larkinella ripae]
MNALSCNRPAVPATSRKKYTLESVRTELISQLNAAIAATVRRKNTGIDVGISLLLVRIQRVNERIARREMAKAVSTIVSKQDILADQIFNQHQTSPDALNAELAQVSRMIDTFCLDLHG